MKTKQGNIELQLQQTHILTNNTSALVFRVTTASRALDFDGEQIAEHYRLTPSVSSSSSSSSHVILSSISSHLLTV